MWSTILRSRVTWGVVLAVTLFGAVRLYGSAKYRHGYRVGFTERAVDARRDAEAAQAIADSAWRVLFTQAQADAQRARDAERAAARARARTAAAESRLANALTVFAADTTTPITPACSELATACALARDAWAAERDTLTALVAVQDTALMTLRSTIADEHTRTRAAVQVALVQQRATFRRPSRLWWFLTGAVLPLTWLVIR